MVAPLAAGAEDPMMAASEQAARLLKAMANPARLRMLCLVAEAEKPVGEIARTLGLREPAASQQLAQLRMENLVTSRREGQRVLYRLASQEVARILDTLRRSFCPPD